MAFKLEREAERMWRKLNGYELVARRCHRGVLERLVEYAALSGRLANPDSSAPVLISGATGCIGRRLVRRLLEDGVQVHLIRRRHSDLTGLQREGARARPAPRALTDQGRPMQSTRTESCSAVADAPDAPRLEVDVVSVHLAFLRRKARQKQVAAMVEHIGGREAPLVVLGDSNCQWHGEDDSLGWLAYELNLRAHAPESRDLARIGVETLYIEPGSLWENGYVESFIGSLRDELLRREVFDTLLEAKILVERWRRHYNEVRPHSSLGYRPPAPIRPLPAGSGALRQPAMSATTLTQRLAP